jgi:hypothetical protein
MRIEKFVELPLIDQQIDEPPVGRLQSAAVHAMVQG